MQQPCALRVIGSLHRWCTCGTLVLLEVSVRERTWCQNCKDVPRCTRSCCAGIALRIRRQGRVGRRKSSPFPSPPPPHHPYPRHPLHLHPSAQTHLRGTSEQMVGPHTRTLTSLVWSAPPRMLPECCSVASMGTTHDYPLTKRSRCPDVPHTSRCTSWSVCGGTGTGLMWWACSGTLPLLLWWWRGEGRRYLRNKHRDRQHTRPCPLPCCRRTPCC
jgi:hypothetical protein